MCYIFFFQAEDGIRDADVTGVQTCALPILSSFNPVVMANSLIPMLQEFVASNPEQQANTLSTLTLAWLSIGSFFLVFDFILTPFRSPYEYEADVYMKAWEQVNHDPLPDKV